MLDGQPAPIIVAMLCHIPLRARGSDLAPFSLFHSPALE